jgi:PAS domain-containing protein
MPDGVAVYEAVNDGEDFVFKDFNPAAEKIEKISKSLVIGKKVTEAFPEVREFGIFKIFQKVWKSGEPEFFSEALYKDQRDSGSWRENWVYKLSSNEIVAIYKDITQIKRAQIELESKYETLEKVAASIDSGLAIISKYYRVVWANKTLTDLGFKTNRKCYEVVHRTDVCPECGVKRVFEEGLPLEIHERKTVDSKGQTTFVEIRVTPIKDKNGNVTSALELTIPITERKKNRRETMAERSAL